MKFKLLLISLLFIALNSCNSKDSEPQTEDEQETPESRKPNILLIIADDMGVDASLGYPDIGIRKPNMPNLQNMINSGITFNNVWAAPSCAPTRAGIITGKYGFRTGVLTPGDVLSLNEKTLHEHLDTNNSGYSHAVIGKWHLSSEDSNPTDAGVGYYAGNVVGNFGTYDNWQFTENGVRTTSTEYITSKLTDLAIDWVDNQTKPWFLWLAYNTPHAPYHLPPADLHSNDHLSGNQADIDANELDYYLTMIEAMDTEMGRLINSMTQAEKDNTVIIFLGDNGTPRSVIQEYPRGSAKGSVFEGGVNVPMVISGKNVTRFNETEDALINTTDLFNTISDLASVQTSNENDSNSFKSLLTDSNSSIRNYLYSENMRDTGIGYDYAIRNTTHKYIRFTDGSEAFYNIENTRLETNNLLSNELTESEETIKNELVNTILEIRGE